MLTLSGNSNITNTSTQPGRFRIYGNPAGGESQDIRFNGTPCFEGFIYAPTATAGIRGGGGGQGGSCVVTGAIWVNKWSEGSNAPGAVINVPEDIDQAFEDNSISNAGLKIIRSSAPRQWQRR
ncbi:hypothetical protein FRE64_04675 [Euhalothece natronophila Z-M001]|uniref:DUF7305 domain-containing protein n=1 Tax=Euhalothece natronophila Z-M001 TaxID=522448 RepID=A0A5B8NJZ2_9CHRO|nr:hypothetical protein [Euhalothece natronophila]QDZ39286.1 hypothetical protein FRE64_04675 [Euhalothece natronophila Z-M001]